MALPRVIDRPGAMGHSSGMSRYAFIFLVLVACGCASPQPNLTLAHNVEVPKMYRAGNFSEEHPSYDEGNSSIERYVNAYERGFETAVQEYAKDINFNDPNPFIMNGWVEETDGGPAGYGEARERIEDFIRVYGKQRVSEYLQQFRLPKEK
jgi:hypothetical protein